MTTLWIICCMLNVISLLLPITECRRCSWSKTAKNFTKNITQSILDSWLEREHHTSCSVMIFMTVWISLFLCNTQASSNLVQTSLSKPDYTKYFSLNPVTPDCTKYCNFQRHCRKFHIMRSPSFGHPPVGILKPLSHGPLIRIRSGSNPDRIRISCVHTDRLIRINMWVETTFRGGFDPHLIRIKDGGG